jgi:Ca-activated chloride channel family protein
MSTKWAISIVLIAAGPFIAFGQAFGDGLLIAEPPLHGNRPVPLSVKYHRVSVGIEGQIAETTVDQVFRNSLDTDLEATYLFPLPEKASISSFSLTVNGKRMSGEMLEKEKARQIYEEIVRRMRDPGLLEYVGRNLFRARVYPVPARGEVRLQLVYTEALLSDGGLVEYVYPLDTERFSPAPIEEVSVSARIRSPVPIRSVYSPSHDVDVSPGVHEATAGFEARHARPDRDFILYYTVSEESLGMNLLTYRVRGEDGYFLLLLSAGRVEAGGGAGPSGKDVVFVLDTSGSMREGKLGQAKKALDFCLENLNKGDRFNIVQFATGVRAFRPGLVLAGEGTIGPARVFVESLEARGGTNIDDALRQGLSVFDDRSRPRMLVFLTDGEPTVGTTDETEILGNAKRENKAGVRMFVFGVGNDVNTHLLDGLAETTRGVSDYVRPHEDLEARVTSFFRKIGEPVLSDISLKLEKTGTRGGENGDVEIHDVYPNTLPDLFIGSQVFIFGRYTGTGPVTFTLTGKPGGRRPGGPATGGLVDAGFDLPSDNGEYGFIPRLWATRKIGYLVDQIRLRGGKQELDEQELVDEIVSLSKEYGIMTPYTSFLILEDDKSYEQWGIRPEAVPSLRETGKKYEESMASKTGESAVGAAKDILDMKARATEKGSSTDTVKFLGAKTFYFRNGAWVDSEYREGMRVVEIDYLGGKYFALLREKPELARYFAVAPQVAVVIDSLCFKTIER